MFVLGVPLIEIHFKSSGKGDVNSQKALHFDY